MTDLQHTLLGRAVEHQPEYAPELLMPIARAATRAALGLPEPLPFVGSDRWTGYELSWLEPGGKPRIAVLRLVVPADTPNLIESKSLKLYLNSYARLRCASEDALSAQLRADLSAAAGGEVGVEVVAAADFAQLQPVELPGSCIDAEALSVDTLDAVDPGLLQAHAGQPVEEALVSHLLKSNCPVTGQPDWASVWIHYRGPRIERASLLRYLLSYREVREFHEQCVERIWLDLWQRVQPDFLAVEARYTRRGGLDINPYRASAGPAQIADRRQWRQ